MKKISTFLLIVFSSTAIFAQNAEDEKTGFQWNRSFIGGSVSLGVSNAFAIGANPEFGYSVTNWLDAGISTNINYFSFRAEVNNGFRQRSTNYGGGIFLRGHIYGGFFLQALPEYNWIDTRIKDQRTGGSGAEFKINQEAPSFLLGAGYGSRVIGRSSFYTILMFDAGNNINSPYIDGNLAKVPVLRAGFNIYLGKKR